MTYTALFASYNSWINDKITSALWAAREQLSLSANQRRFAEIMRLLNHIMVMDLVWLERLGKVFEARSDSPNFVATLSRPKTMDEIMYFSLLDLKAARARLDGNIYALFSGLNIDDLDCPVRFRTLSDHVDICCPAWSIVMHLFNHQAIHRGEVLAHLKELRIDIGEVDFLAFAPRLPIDLNTTPIEVDKLAWCESVDSMKG
jgi:uncharacterized damage-inducible protein DinB